MRKAIDMEKGSSTAVSRMHFTQVEDQGDYVVLVRCNFDSLGNLEVFHRSTTSSSGLKNLLSH